MYAETPEQREIELEGVRAANAALKDASTRRIVLLPDWREYTPAEYRGADILSRFFQSGFIKHWNFFAQKKDWPTFKHILPLPGYEKE